MKAVIISREWGMGRGCRLVTLVNRPPSADDPTPLDPARHSSAGHNHPPSPAVPSLFPRASVPTLVTLPNYSHAIAPPVTSTPVTGWPEPPPWSFGPEPRCSFKLFFLRSYYT